VNKPRSITIKVTGSDAVRSFPHLEVELFGFRHTGNKHFKIPICAGPSSQDERHSLLYQAGDGFNRDGAKEMSIVYIIAGVAIGVWAANSAWLKNRLAGILFWFICAFHNILDRWRGL
jgi:hypothetical protein